MAKQKISDMQRKMMDAVGHRVEVRIVGGYRPCIGKCIDFIQPLDNDPEVASIDIDTGIPTSVTELIEDEIESIIILD